jgi:hypothetical protein
MSITSWVGSVWSLRGVEGPVIGQVRAVEGNLLTMAVVGLGGEPPEGMEILPPKEGGGRFARVSSDCLLSSWEQMGRAPA